MTRPNANVAASVRQRLFNLARMRGEDFSLVLTKFALERVLYRLSKSKHRDLFVLKGALLFEVWTGEQYRPTRNADFSARSQDNPERFAQIFKDLCFAKLEEGDGLQLDASSIVVERIPGEATYGGLRVKLPGGLDNARFSVQIDLGFGDAITPRPVELELPSLLKLPAAKLWTDPRETVIAEKFETAVHLGIAHTRMKDLYDLHVLAQRFSFDGKDLSEAITKTFKTRNTQIPAGPPLVFRAEFFNDADKMKQWNAFRNKNREQIEDITLEAVCAEMADFLGPVIEAINNEDPPPGMWRDGHWTSFLANQRGAEI